MEETQADGPSRRVLIVDDNDLNNPCLRTLLTRHNFPARSQDNDVLNGCREGADYYLTMPLSTRQLVHGLSLVLVCS